MKAILVIVSCGFSIFSAGVAAWIPQPSDLAIQLRNTEPDAVIDLEFDSLPLDGIAFDDSFTLDQLPDEIHKLDGRRVRIHGRMYPTLRDKGVTKFLFIAETKEPPQRFIYGQDSCRWKVGAHHKSKQGCDYTQKAIIVEGVLRIEPWMIDGQVDILFQLQEATLQITRQRPGYQPALKILGC